MEIKQFLDEIGLARFLEKLKIIFSPMSHTHTKSEITDLTVDSSLSSTSTNPVQNKVVNDALSAIDERVNATEICLDDKLDKSIFDEYTMDAQTKFDELESMQADWNQNDESSLDYIANRTHYYGTVKSTVLNKALEFTAVTEDGANSAVATVDEMVTDIKFNLMLGETYTVIYDNKEYVVVCERNIIRDTGLIVEIDRIGAKVLVNNNSVNPTTFDFSEYPFCIRTKRYMGAESYLVRHFIYVSAESIGSHTVEIKTHTPGVEKQLDEMYIPNTIARSEDLDILTEEINLSLNSLQEELDNHTHVIGDINNLKASMDELLEESKSYTNEKTSNLISTTQVNNKINTHNTSTSAHNDIRELISDLATEVSNFLDVDDTTRDQLSEVLTLIDNNKGTLDSLTTSKVNVADIINNLTTNITNKPLSAAQGVAIKALIDALQSELDSHTHAIADVSGLQSALNSKANSSHGTHVSYSTTNPVMDGTASVGTASTVARSDHKHPTDTSRASKTEFDTHVADTTKHITSTERTNWNTAKTHADSAHAPSNAEKNQNAFSNVKVGTTTIAADTTTDTLNFVAGNNVTITPDATNDKITIAATDTTYNAAGSSLGLVKSGGDVTISSGTITVNDDSHNHIISNVDGLQSALDDKLSLSGGTMTGAITFHSDDPNVINEDGSVPYIEAIPDESGDVYPALGIYSGLAGYVNFYHSRLRYVNDPAYNTDAANKRYVDNKISDITPSSIGAASSSHGNHVSYGTSASALGKSSAGSASTVSRSDHVHALPALTSCTGTLTVAKGGTGATTAAGAITNLGAMDLTSAQTASGVKTFSNGIKIGNATLTYDSTNKRLVISVA